MNELTQRYEDALVQQRLHADRLRRGSMTCNRQQSRFAPCDCPRGTPVGLCQEGESDVWPWQDIVASKHQLVQKVATLEYTFVDAPFVYENCKFVV